MQSERPHPAYVPNDTVEALKAENAALKQRLSGTTSEPTDPDLAKIHKVLKEICIAVNVTAVCTAISFAILIVGMFIVFAKMR